MSPARLHDWLAEAPFDATLSSGFFGFFAHTGAMLALEEAGLRASAWTGSSAGALVAACMASGLRAREVAEVLRALRKDDFWDPGPFGGVFQGGLLRGELFQRRLEAMLPARTFEECTAPLAISVYDLRSRSTQVLRSGDLPSAVVASCTVPGLFRPVVRGGAWLVDGGVRDRPGLAGARDARVLYHHLSTRSPWRRRRDLALPVRPALTALILDGLPRVGPNRIDEGPRALEVAYGRTRNALHARLTHEGETQVARA